MKSDLSMEIECAYLENFEKIKIEYTTWLLYKIYESYSKMLNFTFSKFTYIHTIFI